MESIFAYAVFILYVFILYLVSTVENNPSSQRPVRKAQFETINYVHKRNE